MYSGDNPAFFIYIKHSDCGLSFQPYYYFENRWQSAPGLFRGWFFIRHQSSFLLRRLPPISKHFWRVLLRFFWRLFFILATYLYRSNPEISCPLGGWNEKRNTTILDRHTGYCERSHWIEPVRFRMRWQAHEQPCTCCREWRMNEKLPMFSLRPVNCTNVHWQANNAT